MCTAALINTPCLYVSACDLPKHFLVKFKVLMTKTHEQFEWKKRKMPVSSSASKAFGVMTVACPSNSTHGSQRCTTQLLRSAQTVPAGSAETPLINEDEMPPTKGRSSSA
jgi:hypothetical protein